jgi:hypothetical protein
MSQKFRIIFSGLIVALISITAYFFVRNRHRGGKLRPEYVLTTESIVKYLREYDEKTGPGPMDTRQMRTILTDITEKFGSVAFVAISDADFRIMEISRNASC